jgi:hypothetical protein
VTYYHVELPRHAVLLAEGLPAESYLDIGDRTNFANGGGPRRLFPDFSTVPHDVVALWEAKGCAPLTIVGPEVEAVRRLLLVTERMAAKPKYLCRWVTVLRAQGRSPQRRRSAMP